MDLTSLFGGLGNGVASVGQALVEAFKTVSGIFYDTTVGSEGLTLVGWLLIAVLSIGLVRYALNTIFKLFTRIK